VSAALELAARIRRGELSAREAADAAFARIDARNPTLNAFTEVTRARAHREAAVIDARRARGEALPPLAGVPYAVKNLFDVEGLPTLAGSALHASAAAAARDAALVRRMHAAGAVLVGTTNMDAYAYGFSTENSAYGATRNPHDVGRVAGGSSGGSAAAVGAHLVPLALGSDTNGSIRVPASLCGIFGLKPTFGRLSRAGAYPFVSTLDHVGPFARTAADLSACYDALQGHDPEDVASAMRTVEPALASLESGVDGLRVARLTGYFDHFATAEAHAASDAAARALNARDEVELPEAERARAAAFLITAAEGGARHLETLKRHYDDFEPNARDRLLAGALSPGSWAIQSLRFREWFRARVAEVFTRFDLLVAPATPCSATPIGAQTLELDGRQLPLRPSLGLLTQPISFIGLPVVSVPVEIGNPLPIGVQLIAAPWREDLCLRAARALELAGVGRARPPQED